MKKTLFSRAGMFVLLALLLAGCAKNNDPDAGDPDSSGGLPNGMTAPQLAEKLIGRWAVPDVSFKLGSVPANQGSGGFSLYASAGHKLAENGSGGGGTTGDGFIEFFPGQTFVIFFADGGTLAGSYTVEKGGEWRMESG